MEIVFLDTENLRLCPFHLNNEIRENSSFIKILEVIVDRNLTFEQHAEAVIARGKKYTSKYTFTARGNEAYADKHSSHFTNALYSRKHYSVLQDLDKISVTW